MRALPDKMTIGECYDPAMKCKTQKAADNWFAALVERDMRVFGKTREQAESMELSNIGYYSGYCNSETAARVFKLFRCAHPIFGTVRVSAAEALEAGKKLARR